MFSKNCPLLHFWQMSPIFVFFVASQILGLSNTEIHNLVKERKKNLPTLINCSDIYYICIARWLFWFVCTDHSIFFAYRCRKRTFWRRFWRPPPWRWYLKVLESHKPFLIFDLGCAWYKKLATTSSVVDSLDGSSALLTCYWRLEEQKPLTSQLKEPSLQQQLSGEEKAVVK